MAMIIAAMLPCPCTHAAYPDVLFVTGVTVEKAVPMQVEGGVRMTKKLKVAKTSM